MLVQRGPVHKITSAVTGLWPAGNWETLRWLLPRKHPDPFAPLADLAHEIRQITLQAEPRFLDLAKQLQQIFMAAIEFARNTDQQVNSLREILQGAEISGENGIAARAVRELDESLDRTAAMESKLAGTIKALATLQGKGNQLKRLGTRLDVCRTAFAVDCGRDSEYQVAFSGFLDELVHLSAEISKFGETIQDRSSGLRARLQSHDAQTRSSLGRLQQYARLSESAAESSGTETVRLMEQSRDTMREIEQASGRIRGFAQEASYFMQFGDIIRQKLEHVVAALESTQEPGRRARCGTLLTLQAVQLDVTATEIDEAVSKLNAALANMISEGDQLTESLRQRQTSGGRQDMTGSARFRESIRVLSELQGQGRELYHATRITNREASQSTVELAGHLEVVRALNYRMHLLALNAIIKSEGLGSDSATLCVLSTHIHELFTYSNSLVEETIGVLREICPDEPLLESDASSRPECRINSMTEAGVEDILSRLARTETGMDSALASSESVHSAQSAHLAESRNGLDFLVQLAERLRRYGQQFLLLSRSFSQSDPEATLNFDDLAASYTMESERDAHRRVLGADSIPKEELPQSSGDPSDNLSNGDDRNIEFF